MDTKIDLSDKELELVCNTDWILTKHTVVQKVYAQFGGLLPLLEDILNSNKTILPNEIFTISAKISKGENYKLLPYVILDYPRCFGKVDILAVRTFFWWGNFFSISLHLAGRHQINAADKLIENFDWLQQNKFAVCINENPWEHHFDETNFVPLNLINKNEFENILNQKPFVKIAKNIEMAYWQDVPAFIVKSFTELICLLKK